MPIGHGPVSSVVPNVNSFESPSAALKTASAPTEPGTLSDQARLPFRTRQPYGSGHQLFKTIASVSGIAASASRALSPPVGAGTVATLFVAIAFRADQHSNYHPVQTRARGTGS